MINYIIILILLLMFNFNKMKTYNEYSELNDYGEYKNYDEYKNSPWENAKLYDDILNKKINISYQKINPNMNYNPMSNLEQYKTPWNSIETIPNDYLSTHTDKMKILFYEPEMQFIDLIKKN